MSRTSRFCLFSLASLSLWVGCSRTPFPQPAPQLEAVANLRKGGEGAAVATEAAATGTGWGTIVGKLAFEGDAPAPRMLPTGGKDPTACHPEGVLDDSLVVDSGSKGIKNIVIYARKVGRVNEEYEATAAEPVVFDQKNCQFLSHVVALRTSQPLDIKNSDPVAHNTSITPPADKGTNPLLPAGKGESFKFGRQQNVPVPVTCSIHPWMKSYILPRENPYFAVTDAQGAFKIDKLPAGEEIDFQVWHERGNGSQGALVIPGLTDGQGRFKKKLEPDQELDLGAVNVPAGNFKLN